MRSVKSLFAAGAASLLFVSGVRSRQPSIMRRRRSRMMRRTPRIRAGWICRHIGMTIRASWAIISSTTPCRGRFAAEHRVGIHRWYYMRFRRFGIS